MLEDHARILRAGVETWNRWRSENPSIVPSLSGIDLQGADLREINLSHADLAGANLASSNLNTANLERADLTAANLAGAAIADRARLRGAILQGTILRGARFTQNTVWPDGFKAADRGAERVLEPFGCVEPRPL